MEVIQFRWADGRWEQPLRVVPSAQLVLVFAGADAIRRAGLVDEIADRFPNAAIAGCTTAGEIMGTAVRDETVCVTAVTFRDARVALAQVTRDVSSDDHAIGQALADALPSVGLRHILVFSAADDVNGSALAAGISGRVSPDVTISGGLAGDGDRFGQTQVIVGRMVQPNTVVGVAFYGSSLLVGCGSLGGWDPFGPERVVTSSEGNVLYSLDDRPALELYKRYLGEQSADLPASALLFPLSIRSDLSERPTVRTVLSVDDERGSMTFAGDIPRGSFARLMKANFDRLIDGATGAADASLLRLDGVRPKFALLVSCVGRKLLLRQRIEEEVEAVAAVLGTDSVLGGFYSYGELAPFSSGASCELHNQTMTITTFSEC